MDENGDKWRIKLASRRPGAIPEWLGTVRGIVIVGVRCDQMGVRHKGRSLGQCVPHSGVSRQGNHENEV